MADLVGGPSAKDQAVPGRHVWVYNASPHPCASLLEHEAGAAARAAGFVVE